jgi:hypothetical protein
MYYFAGRNYLARLIFMSTGYQIKDQQALHYLTMQIVDWIDVFTR